MDASNPAENASSRSTLKCSAASCRAITAVRKLSSQKRLKSKPGQLGLDSGRASEKPSAVSLTARSPMISTASRTEVTSRPTPTAGELAYFNSRPDSAGSDMITSAISRLSLSSRRHSSRTRIATPVGLGSRLLPLRRDRIALESSDAMDELRPGAAAGKPPMARHPVRTRRPLRRLSGRRRPRWGRIVATQPGID